MSGQRWDVVSIREYTDGSGQQRTSWTKVGVGFTNQNGSINIQLEQVPLNGKLQLQVPISKEERERRRGGGQGGGGGWHPRGQSSPQRGFTQHGFAQQQPQRPQQGLGEAHNDYDDSEYQEVEPPHGQ